jgi:phage terminase large subunit GpA-like protein
MFRRIFGELKPPPNVTLTEWADSERRVSIGSSKPGQWKTSATPYLKEIMNAISDAGVEKVVIMSAAQIGKTDGCVLNPIGYFMRHDPSPILVVQPTLEMAQAFSKERLVPMLNDTPTLRGKINDKKRDSAGTILYKRFPGGYIAIVGANSSAGLRSRPIRILLADEIDAYPPTAGKEGDPLLLAEKRLTTFWNSKEVNVSTPTVKGASRIEIEFENSTKEFWNVPCPSCGALQPLEWGGVVFDKENLGDVRYVCAKCGEISDETEWKAGFAEGRFVAEFPGGKIRGFHLNALSSLIGDGWSKIAEDFLIANEEKKKGNIELLKVWTNTVLGQTWEEEGATIEEDALYKRREKYNSETPEEVICLTAGVDTQDDRFEIEVVGWGYEKESWGVKYHRIFGDPKRPEIWDALDAFLNQTFTKPDGTKLKIARVCVDAGGHFFNSVIKFCKPRIARGVYPIRGRAGFDVPYIPKPSKNNRERIPMFTLGVDTGKALIYQSLGVENEGANYCHFPKEADRGYDEAYFKGLTSEKMVLTYNKGKAVYVWRLKDSAHKRNEPLDCRNYAQAALEISGIVLKKPDGGAPGTRGTDAPTRRGRRIRSGGV